MVERNPQSALRLHRWSDGPLLAVAWISFASGVGQFGAVAALGDVARTFGHIASGTTVADQAGLSGTALGLGLACIRLASFGALPITSLADRLGRRVVLLSVSGLGLMITVLAAASPGYWWFVAIFAAGRPLLSSANSLCSVTAAEETASSDRAKAVALMAAAYALRRGDDRDHPQSRRIGGRFQRDMPSRPGATCHAAVRGQEDRGVRSFLRPRTRVAPQTSPGDLSEGPLGQQPS